MTRRAPPLSSARVRPPGPEPISTIAGEIRECLRPARNDYRATIAMRESGQVQLHQFWFPGWSAAVDGQNVPAAPFGSMAIVSCNLSAGEHVVEFRYEGMPQRRAALLISYAAALCAAAVIVWPRMHLQVRNRGAV